MSPLARFCVKSSTTGTVTRCAISINTRKILLICKQISINAKESRMNIKDRNALIKKNYLLNNYKTYNLITNTHKKILEMQQSSHYLNKLSTIATCSNSMLLTQDQYLHPKATDESRKFYMDALLPAKRAAFFVSIFPPTVSENLAVSDKLDLISSSTAIS